MKIRKTFISNSSSSSFVVLTVDDPLSAVDIAEPDYLINKESRKKLLRYGFKYVDTRYPMDLLILHHYHDSSECDIWRDSICRMETVDLSKWFGDSEVWYNKEVYHHHNLGLFVQCNQDDVIEFLTKNSIPFKATVHYGHQHVFYDGASDYVVIAQNYGEQIDMYYWPDYQDNFLMHHDPIIMRPISDYMSIHENEDTL